MLAHEYELHYKGMGVHEILALGQTRLLANLSHLDNRRLAEWALHRIEFENRIQGMRSIVDMKAKPMHDYLAILHKEYEQDLRENHFVQNPTIDDEEAIHMLFAQHIDEELKKIPHEVEVTLKYG